MALEPVTIAKHSWAPPDVLAKDGTNVHLSADPATGTFDANDGIERLLELAMLVFPDAGGRVCGLEQQLNRLQSWLKVEIDGDLTERSFAL